MKKGIVRTLVFLSFMCIILMSSCMEYTDAGNDINGDVYTDMPDRNVSTLPFPGAGRIDDVKLIGNGETVYEDAEDGSIERWWLSPENNIAGLANVFDIDRQSRVIEFFDNDSNTSFVLGEGTGATMWDTAWRNQTQLTIEFSLRYRVDFQVTVLINTLENQPKFLIYTPIDYDKVYPSQGYTAHHGLGSNATDGTWRTYTRDLNQDLQDQFPTLAVKEVLFLKVLGKCPPPPVLEPSEDPYTLGFWKNNIIKLLNNRKGTQVESLALLEQYLLQIQNFGPGVFNGVEIPTLIDAYMTFTSTSSDPVILLKKQLLASEFNYMNGAYFTSPTFTEEQLINAENLILLYEAGDESVTGDDLLQMKNLMDSFNNGELME